jgi:hypothetical protein
MIASTLPLELSPQPFLLSSLCFCLGLAWDHSTPIYASHVAGMTALHLYGWLIG